jgi:hypothetical protein
MRGLIPTGSHSPAVLCRSSGVGGELMSIDHIDVIRVVPSQNPLSSRTTGRWEDRQGGACDMCSMTLAQLDQVLLRATENDTVTCAGVRGG